MEINILRKVKVFLSLKPTTMLLFLEAFLYLGWARLLLRKPFSQVTQALGTHMTETSYDASQENQRAIREICYAISVLSRHTPWESKCFVRAIAGMKMLQRRRIESTLYLGTARENNSMIAHAWLRSGPFYVTGAEEMARFTTVSTFAGTIK